MLDFQTYFNLTVAQGGALPLPQDGTPTQQAPPAGGGTGGGGTAAPSPFGSNFIFIMLLMVGVMFIFSIRGQRKERKKKEAMLSSVKKHDKVQTIGGVVGSIVEVKNDEVVLKVDESSNTRITFARAAIQEVLSSARGPGEVAEIKQAS